MSQSPSLWQEVRAVWVREWQIELRQRYALNGLMLYVSTVAIVAALGLRLGRAPEHAAVWVVTYWLLVLFIGLAAVGKSFVAEREGQLLALYTWVSPTALLLARLSYNAALLGALSLVALVLFGLMRGLPGGFLGFVPLAVGGALALSSLFTLTAALAAKARNPTTLMAVLSLPLVAPQLITLLRLSLAWAGAAVNVGWRESVGLGALILLPALVSVLLYTYLWRDA